MFYYGFRSSIILVKKIRPTTILSTFVSTPIICLSCYNFQAILKTEFIKRDFHKNSINYMRINKISKEEQDKIDNEHLQKILEDSNNEKIFQLLKYELEYLRQLNEPLPENIRPKHWIELIKLPTKSQQRRYLRFLFINEMKKKNAVGKKEELKQKNLQEWKEKQESFSSGLTYGLGNNCMFMRIYEKTMDDFYNYKMMLSMLFEPKIVFDCGYEDDMSKMELNNCVKQLTLSFVANRSHMSPSHLYFCNLAENGQLMKKLNSVIPNLYEDYFPVDCTSKSYLDIFDRDKLVYLTPHCRTRMASYDPDKIYIIGAIVDKGNQKPYSLAKAKRERIRMEQLPLSEHLDWGPGSGKCLTLNQVLSILLDMKCKKDWSIVLKDHIPPRKLAVNKVDRVRKRMLAKK